MGICEWFPKALSKSGEWVKQYGKNIITELQYDRGEARNRILTPEEELNNLKSTREVDDKTEAVNLESQGSGDPDNAEENSNRDTSKNVERTLATANTELNKETT